MAFTYRTHVKRLLEIVLSLMLAIATAPILLVTALLVKCRLGSPVIFAQLRPGLHGRPFRLYKFRTMIDAYDAHGQPLPDADRLTSFGLWLRSTSLDELPELWNVLRGDMSLVGPRPLLMEYLDRYTPQQSRRHDVKPGLTGLAQINGRNSISWEQKFASDLAYVDNVSLSLDAKILCKTLVSVLCRHAINADSHATMPVFTGLETELQ